jgi:predicted RNA binding protein YcfA (HicA-like mRNA interferase family)
MPYKSKEVLKALKSLEFSVISQTGSHLKLRDQKGHTVILPLHNVTLKKGLFHGILKQAGITEAEFRKFK